MESYRKRSGNIVLEINYYLELLSAIAIVCNDPHSIFYIAREKYNKKYRELQKKYFMRVKMLGAVEGLITLANEYDFYKDSLVKLFLSFNFHKRLSRTEICDDSYLIPEEEYEQFIQEIEKYERGSNFSSFYKRCEKTYLEIIDEFSKAYRIYQPLEFVCEKFNIDLNKRITINLMMGITNKDYIIEFEKRIYICLKAVRETKKKKNPSFSYNPIDWTVNLIEIFISNYVNKFLDDYLYEILHIDKTIYHELLNTIYEDGTMYEYIRDCITRSIVCVYVESYFPDETAELIDKYNLNGFYKVRDIFKLYDLQGTINLKDHINDILKLF